MFIIYLQPFRFCEPELLVTLDEDNEEFDEHNSIANK